MDQATMRLRLRYPGEKVAESERSYKLLPDEVPVMRSRFLADQAAASAELSLRSGQLRYLQNLAKLKANPTTDETENESSSDRSFNDSDLSNTSSSSSELTIGSSSSSSSMSSSSSSSSMSIEPAHPVIASECPICNEQLGGKVVMLVCGHCFCSECIVYMVERARAGTLKCPSCRVRMNIDEITYISPTDTNASTTLSDERTTSNDHDEQQVEIVGSWGTKIEALLRYVRETERASSPTRCR